MEEMESLCWMLWFTDHFRSLFSKSLGFQAKHRIWAIASSDVDDLQRIKVGGHGDIRDREWGLELSGSIHGVWGVLMSRRWRGSLGGCSSKGEGLEVEIWYVRGAHPI